MKVLFLVTPADTRLVVVTSSYTVEEYEQANKDGYSLVTLSMLSKYGTEMLEIKQKQEADSLSKAA